MNCPNCHLTNRETARFCRRCGQWLLSACPNCGTDLPESPVFCDFCGFQVSRLAASGGQSATTGGPDNLQDEQPINPITTGDRSETAAPTPPADAPVESPLQKYIPNELLKKLEAARQSGTMTGERRVVTMLFCDVKGSTAAAEVLDPEDWTEIINGAFEHMIKPVYKYEGTVARLMGDSILAFFGAPIAHEDDPERAVLAGLDIVGGLAGYRNQVIEQYGLEFEARVGINTGPVVVGAVGSDMRMEYTAMGDAINLASRMEQTAEPGTVQIAHDTYKLLAPMFEYEPLGGIEVKGKKEPVLAYRVRGRKAAARRQRGISGVKTPLVGRGSEISALEECRSKVEKGIGGIVGLIGEAGLGKTRLISELKQSKSSASEVSWFETACQSYENSQPYSLIRRLTRRLLEVELNTTPNDLREKIGATSETLAPDDINQTRRVLESLLGLESTTGEPPLEGETFKHFLQSTTLQLWQAQAQQTPIVMVCDDLQWADPASIELLTQLMERTEHAPLLMICSLRPERQAPGWHLKTHADSTYLHRYTELALKPLSEQESEQMLANLSQGAAIPSQLRAKILDKAGGNPYYLEEVVRGLIENEALVRENGAFRWVAAEDLSDFDLPDGLQSLLVSRIDRLEEDSRRTLQLASVVGRSFYYRVLARVGEPSQVLDQHLNQLVRVNMIREAAREPELEYTFSNVMTQEAAYQTILLRHRRQFHRQVGEALEAVFPKQLDELAPLLALHFSHADDWERALKYHTQAGDSAYRLYALDEAVDHYKQALDIALEQVEVDSSSDDLIHMFTRLGRSYEHKYDYENVEKTYAKMLAVAQERGDKALELRYMLVLGTVSVTHTPLTNPEKGQELAEKALALAQELGDRHSEARAHWNLLLLHRFFSLDVEAGRYHGETSLEITRELGWEKQLAFILNDLALIYLATFNLAKAVEMLEESRLQWREMGNIPMLIDNLNVSAMAYNLQGRYDQFETSINEGLELAEAIGNSWNMIPLRSNQFEFFLERGEIGSAIESSLIALEISKELDSQANQIIPVGRLAIAYSELGLHEQGLELCDEVEILIADGFFPVRLNELLASLRALHYLHIGNLDTAQALISETKPIVEGAMIYPFIDNGLAQVGCLVHLATGNYSGVLDLVGKFIPPFEQAGLRTWLAHLYCYRGLALMGTGQQAEARDSLTAGLEIADEIGIRRILWKILPALAELELELGHVEAAEELKVRSTEVINYIADHAGSEENRTAFLNRGDISAALEQINT